MQTAYEKGENQMHENDKRGLPQRNERANHNKESMMAESLREGATFKPAAKKKKSPKKKKSGKYGNSMYDYGNHTEGGIHITHWKNRQKPYGGSNQGGGSIGGGTAGGGGGGG